MRLEKASFKAIKYACLNFHYAKRVPAQPLCGYSIFNNKSEWCGVIVFNNGVGNIEKPFNLKKGEVCELVRIALNGKQDKTSRALSIALKLFKKHNPLVKLIVSYADSDFHKGTLYKASNFIYIGSKKTGNEYIYNNKSVHSRSISKTGYSKQFGIFRKTIKKKDCEVIKKGVKHKFIYFLDKNEKQKYFKNINASKKAGSQEPLDSGRCNPDLDAPINNNNINLIKKIS